VREEVGPGWYTIAASKAESSVGGAEIGDVGYDRGHGSEDWEGACIKGGERVEFCDRGCCGAEVLIQEGGILGAGDIRT